MSEVYSNAFVIFVLSLTGAAVGAYVGAYLREKGKNLATHEDIDGIVEQLRKTTKAAEDIRAEISGELWVKQKRWDFKQQCYSALAENFGEQAATLVEMRALLELQGNLARGAALPSEMDVGLLEKKLSDRKISVESTTEQIRRLGSKVRIAVAPEVRTLLSQVGDRWNSVDPELPFVDQVAIRGNIAHNAWINVMEAARRDLFGEHES